MNLAEWLSAHGTHALRVVHSDCTIHAHGCVAAGMQTCVNTLIHADIARGFFRSGGCSLVVSRHVGRDGTRRCLVYLVERTHVRERWRTSVVVVPNDATVGAMDFVVISHNPAQVTIDRVVISSHGAVVAMDNVVVARDGAVVTPDDFVVTDDGTVGTKDFFLLLVRCYDDTVLNTNDGTGT